MAIKDVLKNVGNLLKSTFIPKRREIKKREIDFAKEKHDEVVSLVVDAKPLCDDLKTTCDEMIEKHIRDNQESQNGHQLTESGFCEFNATIEEIDNFVRKFVEVSVPNEDLKQKLLVLLNSENIEDHFKILDNPKDGNVRGAVGPKKDGDKVVGVEKEVYLGEKSPDGRIATSLYDIGVYIHEMFHAISSKHQIVLNEQGEMKLKELACSEIGEIESKFSEQLFIHILSTKLDEFKVDEKFPFGLSEDEIKKDITILSYDYLKHFLDNAEIVSDVKGFEIGRSKEHLFRYIVGTVGANVLMEEYLKDPEAACRYLEEFLQNDYNLSNDGAMHILNGKKVIKKPDGSQERLIDYHRAMDMLKKRLKEMRNNKVNSVPQNELKDESKKHNEENVQQGSAFEINKHKSIEKDATSQENINDIQIEKGKEV